MIGRANAIKTAALIALALNAAGASAEEFPYQARVALDGAKVFAGPGSHYYDTAELPAGAEVEVYEHTTSGFCAVRPPEGSFSWLPASAVRMTGQDIGEVIRDEAPSRVGSLLHQRRDAVHVRLDLGERVKVVSEQDIDGVRWLQIAPPAGEFRWMRLDDLGPAAKEEATVDDKGWVHVAGHTKEDPGERPDASTTPATVTATTTESAPLTTEVLAPLTGDFGERLSVLEVHLSRQVAEMPTLWRLEPIEQQAAELLSMAETEKEKQAVRAFAQRVDRFATIAGQYKSLRGKAPQVALTKATKPNQFRAATPIDGYDAVGTLRPVVSKRAGAPQYALVDDQGKIVSFVTAPTEINLNHLLGVKVGVQGAKGFMPEYQQPHLTAGRVTQLGRTLR